MEGYVIAIMVFAAYVCLLILIFRFLEKIKIGKEITFPVLFMVHLLLIPWLIVPGADPEPAPLPGAEPEYRCGMYFMMIMVARILISIAGTALFTITWAVYHKGNKKRHRQAATGN